MRARLEAGDDGERERGGARAVDDAVVEGDADVRDGRESRSRRRARPARCEIRCTPRIPTSGALISGVTRKPGELARARHGERRALQVGRSSVPARARSASASTSARSSSRLRSCRSRGRPARRGPARSARRCRGRSGRGRRSRRPRAVRSAPGTRCSESAVARSTVGQEQRRARVASSRTPRRT